jgi:toxin ParE1/3/4
MRIEWSEHATYDLEDIADHFGAFDPTLPETLITRIYEAALPLIDHPRLGESVGHSNLRKWPAKKTPYLLIYEIRGDVIYIVRAVHSMSDWKNLV